MDRDAEFETLLKKYSRGRIPPLTNLEHPEQGLLDGDLLELYHRGVKTSLALPVGLLAVGEVAGSSASKWTTGDYSLNDWAIPEWSGYCRLVRDNQAGNHECELCDRRWAALAEQNSEVIAYLCKHGMLDLIVPIPVHGQVVAAILTGQLRPCEGAAWNSELGEPEGIYRPLLPDEKGINLWLDVSVPRIRWTSERIGISEIDLFAKLDESNSTTHVITPEDLDRIRRTLAMVATQLSNMATSTLELEKAKLIDWIRTNIARSLLPLRETPTDPTRVWKQLALSLRMVAEYFGLNYTLLLVCEEDKGSGVRVLAQHGLSEEPFLSKQGAPGAFRPVQAVIGDGRDPVVLKVQEFRNVWPFDLLYRLKGRRRALLVPFPDPVGSQVPLMVFGEMQNDHWLDLLDQSDRSAFDRIIDTVGLVTQTALLVEQLQRRTRTQVEFVENVAHDIRTPIQAIMTLAEVLSQEVGGDETLKRRAQRISAQARRLHLMSERVWTLAKIDRGQIPQGLESVGVYTTLMEHRKTLLDKVFGSGIEITVDRSIEEWPTIRLNKTLFSQAILNLLDNGAKYSLPRKGSPC